MQYRREIDGLRTVAVLPVILFHAGFEIFSGGFVGVDVFFVISGYLITSILLGELQSGKFSIVRFYERRARRILPALFTVLLAALPVAWLVMMPLDFKDFAQSVVAVSLYVSNFLFWIESGYFDTASEFKPLLHTWSLAVEEQYYVFFPVLLWALWHIGVKRLFLVIIALAVASLALSEWMLRTYPSANFFLLPSRTWELMAGSICAFLQFRRGQWKNEALAGLGLAAILVSIFVYTEATPFPSLWALAPVGGAALIILFAGEGTAVARLLGLPLMVGIGLISYSAYLWHQPVFAFARIGAIFEPSPLIMGGLALLSLLLAYLSWRFVEQPFRRRPVPVLATRRALFGSVAAASLAFILVAGAASVTPLQNRSWQARLAPESLATYRLIRQTWQDPVWRNAAANDPDSCVFASQAPDKAFFDRIRACADRYGPGIALMGDSHGADLFGMVISSHEAPFVVGITKGGCQLHREGRECDYGLIYAFFENNPDAFGTYIYTQIGLALLADSHGDTGTRAMYNRLGIDTPVPSYPIHTRNVAVTVAALNRLKTISPEAEVIWLGPRAEPQIPHPYMIRQGCDHSYGFRPNQLGAYEALDQALAAQLEKGPVRYVSQMDLVGFDMAQDFMTCDVLYFSDGDHYSASGEARFGARVATGLFPVSQGQVSVTGDSGGGASMVR